jgi:hypothetical protein
LPDPAEEAPTLLTPFDDYPIHSSADPVASPVSGDPNHYDRYWFNGMDKGGRLFLAGAMGHYPVRDVVDAAFSVVVDGVERSVFASGRMPRDRSTVVGPIEIEVVQPLRTIRLSADRSATGLGCDLTFSAKTQAVEEPRQRRVRDDGVLLMDHTRLTQWGSWEGVVWVDGETIEVDPRAVVATRDRSWGVRPVGSPTPTNRQRERPQAFWMWAPLHFDGFCTHMALHEHGDGRRWLETALLVPCRDTGAPADDPVPWSDLTYDIEWEAGTRDLHRAQLAATDAGGDRRSIRVEKLYTFRMRGIGYSHPKWGHGSSHGDLEVGREDISLRDFDPLDVSCLHAQHIVSATFEGHAGVGVVEQVALGPHAPTGLRGFVDGWTGQDESL